MAGSRLLVVEDDVEIADAMVDLLRFEGYEVDHARDGREALSALRGTPALPDAILLDLRMPTMDGWTFRAEQRRDPALSRIPVLVMSADGSPQAETIDAAGFLRKPLEMRTLTAEVRRIIQDARTQAERDSEAHRERLSSLGRLAAGMAHEINNPLAWITANLRMLKERVEELGNAARPALVSSRADAEEFLAETASLVSESLEGAVRIREIVQQVRSFSKPQPSEARTVSLSAVLDVAVKMMELQAGHRVRVERSYSDAVEVSGDETQLGQLFVNLLMNAADAVVDARRAVGRVVVRLRRGGDGDAVVEVEDNGVGIPETVRARIFEPFFTTKQAGQGTGLGLFVCHNIVNALGGRLEVDSEPGRGTTMRVTLPSSRAQKVTVAAPVAPVETAARKRILIVEDEPILARALTRLLGKKFDVLAARSVDESVTLLETDRRFDAILCDIHMPERGGPELLDEVKRRWPEMERRMLFMSGGAVNDASQRFIDEMGERVLPKPLELERVEKAVRSL